MPKRYWLVIITYIVAQYSALGLAPILYVFFYFDEVSAAIYGSIIGFIIGLIVILFILREEFKRGFIDKLKDRESIRKIFIWSILGVFLAYAAQTIAVIIEINVFNIKPGSENTAQLMEITRIAPMFVIITTLIAPILEEIIFRKVIFGALYKRTNFIIAGLISALIFGIIHREPSHLLIYATMGFVFAFLYIRSKSLTVPILVHITLNGITVLAQLSMTPEEIEKFQQQWENLQIIIGG